MNFKNEIRLFLPQNKSALAGLPIIIDMFTKLNELNLQIIFIIEETELTTDTLLKVNFDNQRVCDF